MDFGKGFSIANLKIFRQFFLVFPYFEKSYTLCSQLSWSHFRLIRRVDNPKAREYYLNEAAAQNRSTRQLERNISALYYERLLISSDKKELLKVKLIAELERRKRLFLENMKKLDGEKR